jgi:hypothetical protein
MRDSPSLNEAQILEQIIAPGRADFSEEAAKSILALRFNRSGTARIKSLLRLNNRGKITPAERVELEKYLRVGQLLDLLQAKARSSLASRQAA